MNSRPEIVPAHNHAEPLMYLCIRGSGQTVTKRDQKTRKYVPPPSGISGHLTFAAATMPSEAVAFRPSPGSLAATSFEVDIDVEAGIDTGRTLMVEESTRHRWLRLRTHGKSPWRVTNHSMRKRPEAGFGDQTVF